MQHPGLPEMKVEVVATLEMFPSVGCFFLKDTGKLTHVQI